MSHKSFVVGVTGGSGSGKTRFLDELLSRFDESQITLISQDHYYKPIDDQPKDARGIENFDTMDSFEHDRFTKHVLSVLNGEEIRIKEYTFNNSNADPAEVVFRPAPVVLIEGLFIYNHPSIADLLDLKIFIDTKPHLSMKRRILRDKNERGYDIDDVMYRFEYHVMPAYEELIAPHREDSHLIIPNHRDFGAAVEVVASYLQTKVK